MLNTDISEIIYENGKIAGVKSGNEVNTYILIISRNYKFLFYKRFFWQIFFKNNIFKLSILLFINKKFIN